MPGEEEPGTALLSSCNKKTKSVLEMDSENCLFGFFFLIENFTEKVILLEVGVVSYIIIRIICLMLEELLITADL